MKSLRLCGILALAWLAGGFLPVRALADDRLAGYWVPAPEQTAPAVFSIGQLGKWTIVTQRWAGPDPATPEFKVRYLVTTEGNHGTMTADQNLDKLPDVPRSITYQVESGRLTLTIEGAVHPGTYQLVKGTPPAAARPGPAPGSTVKMPPVPRTAPTPAHPAKQISPWEYLLGGWNTEPQAAVQVSLFIKPNKTGGVSINQRWVKGSDSPSLLKAGNYVASTLGGHGVLTMEKADTEGSPVPLVMNFAYEGEVLVITVDDGTYAGQHRLVKAAR
ncbi:MAG: hypothetical protein PSW75_08830 [bacterium]|nr:hypothetical protein [bacterium]MDI1338088.1 hypothetical protein [Lacunisphaera sp.]